MIRLLSSLALLCVMGASLGPCAHAPDPVLDCETDSECEGAD